MVKIRTSTKSLSHHLVYLVKHKLWLKALIGLILGSFVGILLGPEVGLVTPALANTLTSWLALPGNLFLKLVKMIIIPLIFSAIIVGIVSSGNLKFLKKIGPRLIVYFLITTTIAILIGFFVSFLIQPGTFIDASGLNVQAVTTEPAKIDFNDIPNNIINLLPSNPLESMVKGDMLGVVIFTILFGIAMLVVKRKYKRYTLNVLGTIQAVSMTIVKWAMLLVPYAVFGLMTQVTSQIGIQALLALGLYILTVLLGLVILMFVYMIIIELFTKRKALDFLKKILPVQLLAFSTSSSAAVMPLSIKIAEDELKIKPSISRFVIPIGATVNMDGTALYQVVATMFLAQVFGIHLPLTSLILIVVITLGVSIGTPSAPGAGIIVLVTILESVGIPAIGLALILGVDRILDMSRTVVNVTGDLTACSFFDRQLKS